MTIKLTLDEFNEQFKEANEESIQWDPSDNLDVTYKFDSTISQGWRRKVQLRDGISLCIDNHSLVDDLVLDVQEYEQPWVDIVFNLSGKGRRAYRHSEHLIYHGRENCLYGTGLCPSYTDNDLCLEPFHLLVVHVCPSVLYSFLCSPEREMPKQLQHLIKPLGESYHIRRAATQSIINSVLQQILHCPYHGLVKRAYLESKVIELIALVLDQETAIQQEGTKLEVLRSEQLERVHYAREILLRDLSNPPSLEELARQAGLNEFLLKRGFHQAFSTTVFGALRAHRLEMAKHLLSEQNVTVSEVAHKVGYASLPAFITAFKRQFGLTPKAFQKACR